MRLVAIVLAGLALILVIGAFLGIALGPVKLDIHQVLSAIVSEEDSMAHAVVWDLRLPRVAAALVVGACLGLSGALLQSSTRNPLGDPELFGLGGGAALVQAYAITGSLTLGTWALLPLCVADSLVGAGGIALFASRQGISPARLALIGVSISALAAAAATGIMAEARIFSMQSLNFIGGSFANLTWQEAVMIAVAWNHHHN